MNEPQYCVNLEAVIASEYPDVIRDAARRLLTTGGYSRVGYFLRDLSGLDLNLLLGYANAVIAGDSKGSLDNIVLLADMLAQAEGSPLTADATRTGNLMTLIVFEDMARKGILDFFYDNVTLGIVGTMDETIAKLR